MIERNPATKIIIPELGDVERGSFSFVGRQSELELIEDTLESGRQGGSMPNSIISFVGPWGTGKTALLEELAARHRKEPGSKSIESHPSITAYVDLGQLISEGELNKKELVRKIWQQLGEQMNEIVPNLERLSDDQLAVVFTESVAEWSNKATPVILLDTFDALVGKDKESLWWIEENIMEPIIKPEYEKADRTLFVLAGRQEPKGWRQHEVRRRAEVKGATRFLNPFDEETTSLQTGGNLAVNDAIYRHTFGHPEAAHYLVEVLKAQGLNLATANEEEVNQVLEQILPTVLNNLTNEILIDVPAELKEIARHASALRWTHADPLRYLAERLGLAEENLKEEYYLNIIEQQLTDVFYYYAHEGVWRMPQVVRQLLDHSLKLRDPEAYGRAHQAAFLFHGKHLEDSSDYLARYVSEVIYHNLILNELSQEFPELVGSIITMAGLVEEWWPKHLDQWWDGHGQTPPGQEVWQELVKQLEKDEELQALLHPATYTSFLNGAKERAGLSTTDPASQS